MATLHIGFFLKNEHRQASAKQRLMAQMSKTFAFFLSASLAGALREGYGKLAKELESLGPSSNVDVIVQFKQAPMHAHHPKIRKKSLDLVEGSLRSVPACKLKKLAYPAIYGTSREDRHETKARALKGKN